MHMKGTTRAIVLRKKYEIIKELAIKKALHSMLDTNFNHRQQAESSFIESGAGKSKDWKETGFEETMIWMYGSRSMRLECISIENLNLIMLTMKTEKHNGWDFVCLCLVRT